MHLISKKIQLACFAKYTFQGHLKVMALLKSAWREDISYLSILMPYVYKLNYWEKLDSVCLCKRCRRERSCEGLCKPSRPSFAVEFSLVKQAISRGDHQILDMALVFASAIGIKRGLREAEKGQDS